MYSLCLLTVCTASILIVVWWEKKRSATAAAAKETLYDGTKTKEPFFYEEEKEEKEGIRDRESVLDIIRGGRGVRPVLEENRQRGSTSFGRHLENTSFERDRFRAEMIVPFSFYDPIQKQKEKEKEKGDDDQDWDEIDTDTNDNASFSTGDEGLDALYDATKEMSPLEFKDLLGRGFSTRIDNRKTLRLVEMNPDAIVSRLYYDTVSDHLEAEMNTAFDRKKDDDLASPPFRVTLLDIRSIHKPSSDVHVRKQKEQLAFRAHGIVCFYRMGKRYGLCADFVGDVYTGADLPRFHLRRIQPLGQLAEQFARPDTRTVVPA